MSQVWSQYRSLARIIRAYWGTYGGLRAVAKSPYAHASLLLTLLTWPSWSVPGWWDQPMTVLPNMLGFTLGGYAMLMAFGDERFKRFLTGPKRGESPYSGISSTFLHFLILQGLALLCAVVAKSRPFSGTAWLDKLFSVYPLISAARIYFTQVLWAMAFFLFIYAILSAIAASFAVFRVSIWYEDYQVAQEHDSSPPAGDGRQH